MSQGVRKITAIIRRGVAKLTQTQTFSDWFKEAKPADGDIIVINNSFVYRKPLIKTPKNNQYLCLKVKGTQANLRAVFVGRPGEMNSDFKLLSAKSANLPELEPLDHALETEMKRLGQLVFVLIGELQDVPAEVPVNHGLVKKLRFDPSARSRAVFEDSGGTDMSIVVNQLTDPEAAWNDIRPVIEQKGHDDLSSLEAAYGAAFEKLQEEARLNLILPGATSSKKDASFLRRLRESVSEQRKLYETALQQWTSGGTADGPLREVMRIAYNFADDAIKVLQLVVSVADLKGVLLWCTIKEHLDVAEAFRNLPWTKSRKKPSLERYREIIGGARNRAFHNLLAFDRTIEADLGGVDVKARRLTLLPIYGRRKTTVPFDYEDREMVEILTELTRAPEVAVPFDFWRKNAEVMKAFETLLARTEDALWALWQARG